MAHLRITNDKLQGRGALVYLDGKQVEDCREVSVHISVDGATTATLTYLVDALEIDTPVEVRSKGVEKSLVELEG